MENIIILLLAMTSISAQADEVLFESAAYKKTCEQLQGESKNTRLTSGCPIKVSEISIEDVNIDKESKMFLGDAYAVKLALEKYNPESDLSKLTIKERVFSKNLINVALDLGSRSLEIPLDALYAFMMHMPGSDSHSSLDKFYSEETQHYILTDESSKKDCRIAVTHRFKNYNIKEELYTTRDVNPRTTIACDLEEALNLTNIGRANLLARTLGIRVDIKTDEVK